MSEQEAVGVGGGEMDRAYREDYKYKDLCEAAAFQLQEVLLEPRMLGSRDREVLEQARYLLRNEAARVVAVWD
jgi:hypothetical protein